MNKSIVWATAGLFFVIASIAYTFNFLHNDSLLFFGKSSSERSIPVIDIFVSISSMILGIIFGGLYNQLEGRKKVSIIRELKRLFDSASFIRALLVSPIVFCGVYLAASKQPDKVVALFFAFENGFFCHQIFLKRKSELLSESRVQKKGEGPKRKEFEHNQ